MKFGIRQRLFASFAVVLVLMVTVWWVGFQANKGLESELEAQYNVELRGAVDLGAAQSAMWQLRYTLPDYLTQNEDGKQQIVKAEVARIKAVEDNIAAFRAVADTSDSLAALQVWDRTWPKYRDSRPHWFELQQAGKSQEAEAWRTQTMVPASDATVKALDSLINLQSNTAEVEQGEVVEAAHTGQQQQLILLVLALLVGIGAAIFLMQTLIVPTREMAVVARRLAKGELGETLRVRSDDEIGQLAEAFNAVSDYQRRMANVANKLAQGDVSVDADPISEKDVLGTAFQRMVANLRRKAMAADALSRGDISAARVVELRPESDADVFGLAFQRLVAKMRLLQAHENRTVRPERELAGRS
ncbi:MAG: MCP four helix bundle domain-containing protein [Thermomicrobiales bacterium]